MIDDRTSLLRDYLKETKGLSDRNVDLFIKEYEQLSEKDKSELIYEAVGKEIYKENPVDIETFINPLTGIGVGCFDKEISEFLTIRDRFGRYKLTIYYLIGRLSVIEVLVFRSKKFISNDSLRIFVYNSYFGQRCTHSGIGIELSCTQLDIEQSRFFLN